jgi:hypothetical protein
MQYPISSPRRFGFNPRVIVAAPGYLAQHGTPKRI